MLKEASVRLIESLNVLIKKYSRNEKVRKIIMNEFSSRNMKASLGVNILNEKLELSTLDIDTNKDLILLFVFTQGMYNALTFKDDKDDGALGDIKECLSIVPEDYFTEIEITNLSGYKLEKELNIDNRIVFSNMIKVAEGHWRGIISSKQLAEIDSSNDIVYNFKNQRDYHIDIYGMKRIKIDKAKILTIKNRLLSGKQFSDEIRINLLHDGEDKLIWNEKTGELICVSGTLNIIDGYHRKTANSMGYAESLSKNQELDFNWGLAITNFSEKKAQDFMVQINEQKPIKQEYIKSMDTSSLGNVVVDAIRDIDTSEFATKIKDSDAELNFDGMAKKATLVIAIEENYKAELTTRLQAKPIAKHIAEVMDYIIGLYVEQFIVKPEETKKVSYINHKNMFAGYIALSKRLYGVKNWEEEIEQILSKIDFSNTNEFWKDIKFSDQEMTKTTRKHLYKLFGVIV